MDNGGWVQVLHEVHGKIEKLPTIWPELKSTGQPENVCA
jgi:hypothetical protein